MTDFGSIMWIVLAVVVLIVCVFLKLWLDRNEHKRVFEYSRRNCVMTESERKCFFSLVAAVGDVYYVFPQVHLPTILDNRVRNGQNWFAAFRHIDEKSVDFVLCRKDDLYPVLAIELDDKTHEWPKRQERDREVERIFKGSGLPLLRMRSRDHYDPLELKKDIVAYITPN